MKLIASLFTGIIALIFGLSLAHPAAAATTLTSCQRILQSGDYILGQDVSSSGTCFSIRASNVTFDGANHTITVSSGDALEVAYYDSGTPAQNVTVKNIRSAQGLRAYGDTLRYLTFTANHVNGITNYAADDVTITDNVVGEEGISVNNADREGWSPYRNTVSNNSITGGSTDVKILLEVVGGRSHPCPRLDTVITNNTVTSTRNDPPPEATAAVRVRCATHTVFTDNTITSTGTTIGLYMRDESDDGQYLRNSFTTNSQEVLRIASGNVDKTFPARNVFANNIFHSTSGAATYLQGIGSGNTFSNNLFWSAKDSFISGADGNTFNHNTFYVTGSGESIHTFDYDHGPADQFTNNIFSYSGAVTAYGFDGWAASRYLGRNNLFQNRSGSVRFFNYGSLAQWQAGVAETNSLEGDPQFVNPGGGDFHLATGSLARSRGTDGRDLGYDPDAVVALPSSGPTVNWPSPMNGARLTKKYTVKVGASDPQGVAKVTLAVDGQIVSTDTKRLYRLALDTRPFRDGTHTVTVTATDKTGATTSITRTYTFTNRFQTKFSLSTSRSNVHGNMGIKPLYIYGGGDISSAVYYLNDQEIGRSTTSPYNIAWDSRTVRNGRYRLVLRLTDVTGAVTNSLQYIRVRN